MRGKPPAVKVFLWFSALRFSELSEVAVELRVENAAARFSCAVSIRESTNCPRGARLLISCDVAPIIGIDKSWQSAYLRSRRRLKGLAKIKRC